MINVLYISYWQCTMKRKDESRHDLLSYSIRSAIKHIPFLANIFPLFLPSRMPVCCWHLNSVKSMEYKEPKHQGLTWIPDKPCDRHHSHLVECWVNILDWESTEKFTILNINKISVQPSFLIKFVVLASPDMLLTSLSNETSFIHLEKEREKT